MGHPFSDHRPERRSPRTDSACPEILSGYPPSPRRNARCRKSLPFPPPAPGESRPSYPQTFSSHHPELCRPYPERPPDTLSPFLSLPSFSSPLVSQTVFLIQILLLSGQPRPVPARRPFFLHKKIERRKTLPSGSRENQSPISYGCSHAFAYRCNCIILYLISQLLYWQI